MKKRGQHLVLWYFVELIAAIFIGYLFLTKGADAANNMIFNKIYLSNDVALTIDGLNAIPGEISVAYPSFLSDYVILVDDSEVSVMGSEKDLIKYSHPFNSYENETRQVIRNKESIFFMKRDNYAHVFSKQNLEYNERNCPGHEEPGIKIAVFDPAQGYTLGTRNGFFNDSTGIYEAEYTYRVVQGMDVNLALKLNNIQFTRSEYDNPTITERKTTITSASQGIFISIHLDNTTDYLSNSVIAEIPYDSPKSRRLACLIIAEFEKEFKKSITTRIMISEDPLLHVDSSIASVKLTLGNVNTIKEKNFLLKDSRPNEIGISKMISDGIERFI